MTVNNISAIFAVLTMLLVARGFFPLLSVRKKDFLAYATMGVTLLVSATMLRMGYWDMVGDLVPRASWRHFASALGGKTVNVIPNLMTVVAGLFLLKARLLLIPETDRESGRWNLLTAAFYPAHKCIVVRLSMLRRK